MVVLALVVVKFWFADDVSEKGPRSNKLKCSFILLKQSLNNLISKSF